MGEWLRSDQLNPPSHCQSHWGNSFPLCLQCKGYAWQVLGWVAKKWPVQSIFRISSSRNCWVTLTLEQGVGGCSCFHWGQESNHLEHFVCHLWAWRKLVVHVHDSRRGQLLQLNQQQGSNSSSGDGWLWHLNEWEGGCCCFDWGQQSNHLQHFFHHLLWAWWK